MELKNKVAIITGGNSGLGAACAAHLRTLGAKVAILDNAVIESNTEYTYQCDVRDSEAVSNALEAVERDLGPIQICIQCAGVAPAAKIVSKNGPMPLSEFEKVIQINLIGTFNVMRLVLAKMQSYQMTDQTEDLGVVINTASIAAFEGQIGQAAYSASKGGVISMTLPVAREMAKWKIRINAIAPGLMETPMLLNMPSEVQSRLAATVPYPTRLGKPHEFALLCQQVIENSYLNGTVIRLDGALRMEA